MLTVREDFGLVRQVRAAAIDEVDARQMVFHRNFLRAQVFLDGDREIGAAFDGRVIADDQAFPAFNAPDTRDQARARRFAVIHTVGGQGADLEEGAAGVDQALDPLTGQQLAAFGVAAAGVFRAAESGVGGPGLQVLKQGVHGLPVGGELRSGHIQRRFQNRHAIFLNT